MRREDAARDERAEKKRAAADFRARGSRPCVVCAAVTTDRRDVLAWSVPCCAAHEGVAEIEAVADLRGIRFVARALANPTYPLGRSR